MCESTGSPEERFALLVDWAVRVAERVALRTGLARWREDIVQDARVALWMNCCQFADIPLIKRATQMDIRDSLRRYKRWDDRELSGLQDLIESL